MMKIDKFYDWLLKNGIHYKRVYVKENTEEFTSKISRILNEDVYRIYRNQKGFSSYMKPTVMGSIMEKRNNEIKMKRKNRNQKIESQIEHSIDK